jgi:tetratricopeptide (TPR) repeat protein
VLGQAVSQRAAQSSRVSSSPEYEAELQRANRFERQGNYTQSLAIYLELFERPEARQRAYEGVLRAYLTLERWEDLEAFVRDRVAERPEDLDARLLLGQSLAQQGRTSQAKEVWEETASYARGAAGVLERSARLAQDADMLDEAIEFYLDARERREVPALYAQDLSVLYMQTGKLDLAVGETLGWLEANPQQQLVVQGELRRILWDPDHQGAVREILLEETRDRPQWTELARTVINLWIEMGECDEALEVAERSREAAKPPMISLVVLGDQFREKGCQETAVRAFRAAIEGVPGDRKAALVRLGHLWMDEGRDRDAAREFHRFLKEFPTSPDAADVRCDLGHALLRSGQPEQALEELRTLIRAVPTHPRIQEARFLVAECLIGLGRLDEAATALENLSADGDGPASEEILYRRGEILFLAGRFDDALESFQSVIHGFPRGRYVNDAVSRVLLISGSRLTGDDALSTYANALYFRNLGQWPRALAKLDSLEALDPDGPLVGQALLTKAEIQMDAGYPGEALRVLDRILDTQPNARQAPHAMEMKGDILIERMDDAAGARQVYESMLMQYPDSPLLDGVRRKLRALEEAVP